MQDAKKKYILKALSKATLKLRGNKSRYMLSAEYDIPYSVLNYIENEDKDPQLTTLFKLARAFDLSISEFMKEIEKELPKNFSAIDE